MKMTETLLAELERETKRSRRALEAVPEGKRDWKPHQKSMQFGYLTDMVATIPSWVTMIINQDELDVAPKDGQSHRPPTMNTSAEFIAALDKSAAEAREALEKTTDEHLKTTWKLLAAGNVVAETSREEMISDTLNHWAHHRGQMTVYLRLLDAPVPALYGPSADDRRFD